MHLLVAEKNLMVGNCAYRNEVRKGDVAHGLVLNRAMELCKNEEGECIWPDIPEMYWQQEVKEMIKFLTEFKTV